MVDPRYTTPADSRNNTVKLMRIPVTLVDDYPNDGRAPATGEKLPGMDAWSRLVTALGDAAPRLGLRPPATETQLVATEVMLRTRLPADYRAWLAIADGQEPWALSILPSGGWFVSLDRLLAQWMHERQFDLDDYDDIPETQDDDRVRFYVFHPKRITIAGSEYLDGDNTVLDLIPGPAGTVGQIANLVSECDYEVIGTSLSAYFTRVAELLETGQLAPRQIDADREWLLPDDRDRRWEWLVRGERRPRRGR